MIAHALPWTRVDQQSPRAFIKHLRRVLLRFSVMETFLFKSDWREKLTLIKAPARAFEVEVGPAAKKDEKGLLLT